jgi:hypothetical protein
VIKKALVQQVFGQALSRFSLARLPFFPKDTGFAGETPFLNPIYLLCRLVYRHGVPDGTPRHNAYYPHVP